MTAADLDELLYGFIANNVMIMTAGDAKVHVSGHLGASFIAALRAAPAGTRLALAREIAPDQYAVVPRGASKAMLEAGYDASGMGRFGLSPVYRAMVAAAEPREGGE